MDVTLQLLNTSDATSVLAGLQCLLSIFRSYRFKAGEIRKDLDTIIPVAFPPILDLGNKLLQEDSDDAGAMLRLIVKCYKHAIYVRKDKLSIQLTC
jgi:importin-7